MPASTVSQYDVIVHIGLPKTGSSAIQKFCLDNQRWLSKQGAHYPRHGLDKNGVSGGHDKFYKLIHANDLTGAQDYLRTHLAKAKKKQQQLIISSEGLHLHAEAMAHVLQGVSAAIVGFVRHPFDSLFSGYNQMVKRHYQTQPLDDYVYAATKVAKPILEGRTLFEFAEKFSEHFITLPYHSDLTGPSSVLHQFFNLLGFDTQYVTKNTEAKKINSGYSASALEFKRLLNYVLSEEDRRLNSQVDHELQALCDDGRFSSASLRDTLAAESFVALDKKFSVSVDKIQSSFGILLPKPKLDETRHFSSLDMLCEITDIVKHFKSKQKRLYETLKDRVVSNSWKHIDADKQKLCDLFDHSVKQSQKEKTAFFHPNVIKGMPNFDACDFYRETARLFWQRGDINTAYSLICRALELRKGPVIKKMHADIEAEYQASQSGN
ncbi:hypothetical protein ACFO4O_04510 [Glaciecola siphonariae]|uniref:Sulfotransferase domain-containing protein n=1 Tax=Glaciecola siphonariae TaxID=521012 RepID=A0ABV9LTY5_9ALTE